MFIFRPHADSLSKMKGTLKLNWGTKWRMISTGFSTPTKLVAMPTTHHRPQSKPEETHDGLYRFKVAIDDRGGTLTVLSDPAHRLGYCIGNQLWSSAEELVLYFSRFSDQLFQGRRILELGAGLGLPGQVN